MRARHHPTSPVAPWRLSLIAAFCLAIFAFAVARPAIADQHEALLNGQGLLWRIDTPGSEPSYLFGTIHLTDRRVTRLPPQVVKAIDESDSLTVEIVLDDAARRALAREVRLTGERDLEDILGSELYRRVLSSTRSLGMTDEALRTMRPWVIMGMISLPRAEIRRAASGRLNVDQVLQAMATERGIPLLSLETVAEQADALGGMPEPDMVRIISEIIAMQSELRGLLEELIRYYLARDLAGYHARTVDMSTGFDREIMDRFMERVLDRRNHLMADRMADELAAGRAFVGVGAMHLPGEHGLLNLLEQRGHGITRIY